MIVLAENPPVTHRPEEALALVLLALLVLAVGVGSCLRAARRDGLSLREWWDDLR